MDTSLPPGALPEPKARLSSVVTAIGLLKAFYESDIEIGASALGQKRTSRECPLLAQSGRSHGRSTDAAFRQNMSSEGNDGLAELAAVLQIAVHFHHIVELECSIDHRLERTACKAPCDVFHGDLPACRVAQYQPDAVALDRRHLGDHLQHRYRGVTLA
jgi:hypothetical protein